VVPNTYYYTGKFSFYSPSSSSSAYRVSSKCSFTNGSVNYNDTIAHIAFIEDLPVATWQGSFKSYYTFDKKGRPLKIGYEFHSSVLENLPTTESDGKNDVYTCPNGPGTGSVFQYKMGHTFEAFFPTEVKNGTSFKDGFISVYPLGISAMNGVKPNPVIDFYFELISRAEREAIPARYCVQDICNVTSHIGAYYVSMKCDDMYQVGKGLPPDETPPIYAQDWNLIIGHVGNLIVQTTKPSWTPDLNDGISPSELKYVTCYGHICGIFVKAEFDHLNTTIKVSARPSILLRHS
jgi:hypothetical protein